MEKLEKEFITSLITVIVAISAIGLFISSGGSILFYITVAIAIIVGFYNAWLISQKPAEKTTQTPSSEVKKKTAKKYKK